MVYCAGVGLAAAYWVTGLQQLFGWTDAVAEMRSFALRPAPLFTAAVIDCAFQSVCGLARVEHTQELADLHPSPDAVKQPAGDPMVTIT